MKCGYDFGHKASRKICCEVMGSINRGQERKSHGACMQSEQLLVTGGKVCKEDGKDRVGNAPAPTIQGPTSKTM